MCGWSPRKIVERPSWAHYELDGDRVALCASEGTVAEHRYTLLGVLFRQQVRTALLDVIAE